jgi:hypothetical protein
MSDEPTFLQQVAERYGGQEKTFLQRVRERQEREAAQQETEAAPPHAPAAAPTYDRQHAYAQATLDRLAGEVAMAIEGTRNGTLNERALRAYRVADACAVDREFVTARMTDAARRCGLDDSEIANTLASARDGADKYGPADIPERETYSPAYTIEPSADDDDEPPMFTDMAALLAGALPQPPKPSLLHRTDGIALFYRGKRNEVYGDPEDGKTMFVLAGAAEELRNGGRVLFMDLDDNGDIETADRLLMLGAPRDALTDLDRFRHCQPHDVLQVLKIVEACTGWADFVIIDCVGELMPLFGANSDKADDYSRVMGRVAAPLTKAGAAVVLLDHLAKNTESRAYGAAGTMAKRRAINGVSINLKAKQQFTPGVGGTAELIINKDRPGGLRRNCPAATGRRQFAGTFVLDAPDTTGRAAWRITPEAADTVTTTFDAQAIEYLHAARELPQPFTVDELASRIGGEVPATESQRETARRNIDKLTADGQLEVVREPKRGRGGAGQWRVADPK